MPFFASYAVLRRVCCLQDSLTLSWEVPACNGSKVNFYEVDMDDGRGGAFGRAYAGEDTQCVVCHLQSGLTYRFRVKAQNGVSGTCAWQPQQERTERACFEHAAAAGLVLGCL